MRSNDTCSSTIMTNEYAQILVCLCKYQIIHITAQPGPVVIQIFQCYMKYGSAVYVELDVILCVVWLCMSSSHLFTDRALP